MKKILLALLCAAAARAAVQASSKKMEGDDLSNMVIQGESRMQAHPQIPALEWKPELYKNVAELMREDTQVARFEAPVIQNPPLSLAERSASEKTASPWLAQIYEAPVLRMAIHQGKKDVKQEWTFLVKDSRGKTFYEERKKGGLPEEIEWNGFGDRGEPLRVGYDYTYSLSLQDEGGNPQRFAGKPFRLGAFRYAGLGKTVTAIDEDQLFQERSSLQISIQGRKLLTEVKDFLRTQEGRKIEVAAYADDVRFAASRADAVKKLLQKALDLDDEAATAQGMETAKGGGYPHVEIIVK